MFKARWYNTCLASNLNKMLKNLIHLNMPYDMDFIIFKKKKLNLIYILFFNEKCTFKYLLDLKKNRFQINKDTNTLMLEHNNFYRTITLDINLFLVKLLNYNLVFLLKIKFKGKGYKIKFYKKTKIMFFFFNRSHLSVIKFNKIGVIRLNKYKFILSCFDLQYLRSVGKIILNIRRLNLFTSRGLRLSKQIIFKRKGKKSSYS